MVANLVSEGYRFPVLGDTLSVLFSVPGFCMCLSESPGQQDFQETVMLHATGGIFRQTHCVYQASTEACGALQGAGA